MHIAIIETGAPPEQLARDYPSYPKMMERMLSPHAPGFSYSTYRVFEDGALPRVSDFDGLLITGSAFGVYEDHAWLAPLETLIRDTAAAGKPQVGICFGHQLMAQAFGGAVKKSDKGWGLGVHRYDVGGRADWMQPAQGKISCIVVHQDQVIDPPPGAVNLAGSEFCEYGVLAYAQGPAISFQMHPEFSHEYVRDLLKLRRQRYGEALVDNADATLARGSDRELMGRWISNFFKSAG